MNQENLIPNSQRSPEELREMGKKGGIKSGEVRRERKAFKEALLLALETRLEDGRTVQDAGIESLMAKYINGDLDVFKAIRDTVGEKPVDALKLGNENEDKPFEVNINVVK